LSIDTDFMSWNLESTKFRQVVEVISLRLIYLMIILFLVSPLVIVIASSFNNTGVFTFPPENLSLKWYYEFISSDRWISAFKNSLIIGVGTTMISTPIGLISAYGFRHIDSQKKIYLIPVVMLPLLIAPVVIGVVLVLYLSLFNLYQTHLGIMIAHSLWGVPLAFFIMQSVFRRFNWELRDAALDLGATPYRAFIKVVFPGIKQGVVSAGLIVFIVSLQEFIMALFLSGYNTETVPVLAWNSLRNTLNPIISVTSTILIFFAILLIVPVIFIMSVSWVAERVGF